MRAEPGVSRRGWPLIALAIAVAFVLGGGGGFLAGHAHLRTIVGTVTRVQHEVNVKTITQMAHEDRHQDCRGARAKAESAEIGWKPGADPPMAQAFAGPPVSHGLRVRRNLRI